MREAGGDARICVARADGGTFLELEIHITSEGPIVRARAAAIEIESGGDLVARCGRFRIEARESIELASAGRLLGEAARVELEATRGCVQVRANDDVQLLGEKVLLNCERSAPLPPFLPPPPLEEATMPREDEGGNAQILLADPADPSVVP